MKCYICGESNFLVRKGEVRDLPETKIYECPTCGLVFLDSFEHIHDAFYEDSPIVGPIHSTIDAWLRITEIDDQRRFEKFAWSLGGKKVLDFGCGAGGFLIKCKEVSEISDGIEPEKQISEYWKGELNIWQGFDDIPKGNKYDLITAFHVLEHLHEPREVLKSMVDFLEKDGKIIVEVPSSEDALLSLYDSAVFQRFTYWSQHLYLYNMACLERLAKQAGLRVVTTQYYQRYPLSNHLYWLSKGLPGGHEQWGFLDSPELTQAYGNALASVGKCDTLIAYLEV